MNRWLHLVLVLLGLFAGNTIGIALGASVPPLAAAASATLGPVELSLLDICSLTLGFSFHVNLMGAVLAIVVGVVGSRL